MPARRAPANFRKTIRPKIVAKIRRTKQQAYTNDWDSISRAVRKRDGNKCTNCGASGKEVRLESHHILRVASGGQTVGYNLTTLCKHCHDKKHRRHR